MSGLSMLNLSELCAFDHSRPIIIPQFLLVHFDLVQQLDFVNELLAHI